MAKTQLSNAEKEGVVLASGSTHPQLAEATAESMGMTLAAVDLHTHPNSENYVRYEESIRGKHVVILQTHAAVGGRSVNDALQEQILMIDAANRASAREITAVIPMFGYSRQDRKSKGRESIAIAAVIRQLEVVGADRLVSVDMHSAQVEGNFTGPFDHMTGRDLLRKRMRRLVRDGEPDDFVMVSPDAGRARVTEDFAIRLGIGVVHMPKVRDKKNPSQIIRPKKIGEVGGKTCMLSDDMIDTAGTLVSAAETLHRSGAAKIIAFATHGVFSEPAFKRIQDSPIDAVVVTDTLPMEHAQFELKDQLRVVSIAPVIGRAIGEIVTDGSVSTIFNDQNHM